MTGIQWLLLILVVAVVAGAYFYMRRQTGDDPWKGMEETGHTDSDTQDADHGESLGGDSYILGVRTISSAPEASEEKQEPMPDIPVQPPESPAFGDSNEPAWQDFKAAPEPALEPEPRQEPASRETGHAETMQPQRASSGEEKLFVVHVGCRDRRLFDGPAIHRALQDQKLKFGLNSIYHRITETNGVPESVFGIANMLEPGFLDPVEQDHLQTPGVIFFLQLPGPIEGTVALRDLLETASNLAEQLGAEVLDSQRSLLKPQMAQSMLDEVVEFDRKQRLNA